MKTMRSDEAVKHIEASAEKLDCFMSETTC